MSKTKTIDLTSGPILKTLAELALPIMASSLLGTAYNITDMAWISYCKENEVLPRLARELGIADLAQQVEEFRTHPTAEGVNLKGKKRTTLKLFIPNLTFPEPVEMGENVWIYMGELCPAYCLFTPWEETKEN